MITVGSTATTVVWTVLKMDGVHSLNLSEVIRMLKKMLADKGIELTDELSKAVIQDVAFNHVGFNKMTTLQELLAVAERCDKAIRRCA